VSSFPDIRIVDETGASVAKYEGTRDAKSSAQSPHTSLRSVDRVDGVVDMTMSTSL
jgi:hypothetical protein